MYTNKFWFLIFKEFLIGSKADLGWMNLFACQCSSISVLNHIKQLCIGKLYKLTKCLSFSALPKGLSFSGFPFPFHS